MIIAKIAPFTRNMHLQRTLPKGPPSRPFSKPATQIKTSPHNNNHVSREEHRTLVQEVDFRKTEVRINEKIATIKTDLTKEISAVRTELKETEIRINDKIDTVKTDLTKEISAVRTELKETQIRINDKIDTVKTDLTKEISALRTDLKETEIRINDKMNAIAVSIEKLGSGIYRALFGAVLSVLGIIGAAIYSHPDGRNYLADIVRGEPRQTKQDPARLA